MEQPTVSLSSCIKRIISSRGLTVSKLTTLLNYPSETSLRRVMRNEAKLNALKRVKDDLIRCGQLKLSDNERKMLNSAIWFHEKGNDYYTVHQELWALLQPQIQSSQSLPTFLEPSKSPICDSSAANSSANVECLILNSCFDSAMCYVKKLIRDFPKISIHHYFAYPKEPYLVVRTIRQILPLIGMSNYEAFTGYENELQIPGYNIIAIRFEDQENEIVFIDDHQCIETVCDGAYEKWFSVVKTFQCREITTQIQVADIATLLERCYVREKGRESIEIRPDLCIRYICPDIVRAAFKDQCRVLGISISKEEESVLLGLHNLRYSNIFESDKTNCLIMSRKALSRFLNYGMTCDHARLMRPYTVSERIQILTVLLNHAINNPHFFIHFLKEQDEDLLNSENPIGMACFGEESMQIDSLAGYESIPSEKAPKPSDYEPYNYEIEIKDRNFVMIFRDFYINDVLNNHTCQQEETMKFLSDSIKGLSSNLQ